MSDIMRPVPFTNLVKWIEEEYKAEKTIFGIPEEKFYKKENNNSFDIFNEKCETPIGPAAGPHTQSTQNIVAAYLTGGRFFELKTVQIMDTLDIEKPCIEATDEGYNTEWSTELTVPQAYAEYIKAWFLLHLIEKKFKLSTSLNRAFVFNMSVGYDLKGIKSKKIDTFIEDLKDASNNDFFKGCKMTLKNMIENGELDGIDSEFVEAISPIISNSITLSTMHGCPPEDQEAICKYLMSEKKLHTFVKLNPTLHGYKYVREAFDNLGYTDIKLKEESFTHDMQYDAAIKMLNTLLEYAAKHNVQFGVKLSNTLAVVNDKGILPTDEMYMSGRALFPLTINLAAKLSKEFDGKLKISYSGGANKFNIKKIFSYGIRPITIATDLLKPGGYVRFKEIAEELNPLMEAINNKIDVNELAYFAEKSLKANIYKKENKSQIPMKLDSKLDKFDCFVAPCVQACPINQDVPEYIRLISEERFMEAFQLIISKNPLPHITGYICDHQCMFKCVRNDYDDPVLIRDLKRVAAEKSYEKYINNLSKNINKKDEKIAVIGAGPAGLASAYFLAREGFDVTIFDKTDKAGGMVQHGIPEFRLPDDAIEKDIDFIKQLGVKIVLNAEPDFSVEKLKNDGFKYINLAIGAWKSRMLKIDGDQHLVEGAIKFLQDFNKKDIKHNLGKNVAVIGGGNSAMDGARAAGRVDGVEKVYIIYRRTIKEMPADREELDYAKLEGVIFKELVNPISLKNGILKCQVMELGEPDESGRRRPIPVENKFEEIEIDFVLSAIGELVDYDILKKNGIEVDAKGNIVVNDYNETNLENVFITGDAYRGPATVVQAIADAQKAAYGILNKENIEMKRKEVSDFVFDYNQRLDAVKSKKGVLGYSRGIFNEETNPDFEANRCLECNLVCNKCVEVCPNRANIAVQIQSESFKNINQILHMDALCNECGNCETFCPHQGAPYKDKYTLFWSEEDFDDNGNDGFLLISKDENINFKMRFDSKIIYVSYDKSGKLMGCGQTCSFGDKKEECHQFIDFAWKVFEKYPYLF